eukprot:CAMPEP_0173082760 /NCGR_PEP_ID=MMETSP1102-20130122/18709_1 /TAXON_ID=49646 /ORGANISM="Geminigera sp., Strain Caron Lab Isolate" /LENGTH=114 /DNA_ID=CAMNT_0013958891 /DNA_START=82 /DNA_END=426 /DNA_ORIENTATION=-
MGVAVTCRLLAVTKETVVSVFTGTSSWRDDGLELPIEAPLGSQRAEFKEPSLCAHWGTRASVVLAVVRCICTHTVVCLNTEMFSANKQQTTKLWMWRMEYLHHEQRPLYFGEWF